MDFLRKLPVLAGAGAAIVTGIIGYAGAVSNRDNMVHMLVAMAVFFVLGLYVRSTFHSIFEYQEEKRKKLEQERLMEEAKKRAEEAERHARELAGLDDEEGLGTQLDLRADDDFGPLPVADFIRQELGE